MFYIKGRKLWGARPPKSSVTRDDWCNGVQLVIHHTADQGPRKDTYREERRHLQSIQTFHQQYRGWNDIGYNYLIMPSGRVWEGRGFNIRGAHVAGHNTNTCGIAFVGTYTDKRPSVKAVFAYRELRKRLKDHGAHITTTVGHGDLMPTACPGSGVRKALDL